MVSVLQRMRRMKTLLAIRLGPGAAILPKNVERLHMNFAIKINDGHRGPRQFWRRILPRLKYHNPGIPMTVSRTTNQTGPATLSIFFGKELPTHSYVNEAESSTSTTSPEQVQEQDSPLSPSETLPSEFIPVRHLEFSEDGKYKTRDGAFLSKVPAPSPSQNVVTIDMKHKTEEQILKEFMKITGGKEIQPTQGELDTLKELEEFRERARKDSERSKAVREKWKKQQEMLKQARGELEE